jgi:hypothetical protein
MAVNFPNSPTNGQTVTIGGVVYSWNSTTSTWDLVSSISTLDELQNVNAPTPSDNNLLAYDSGTSNWTNQTAAQAGVATATHTHPQSDVTNLTSDLASKVSNNSFYAGGKNVVINGGMDIWQRSTSSTTNINYGSADRWAQYYNLGTSTFSRETTIVPTGFTAAMKITQSVATGTDVDIVQAIESLNATALAGQTVTLSAYVAASASVTGNLILQYSNSTDVGPFGSWINISGSGGFSPSSTTYQRVSAVYAIPASAKSIRVAIQLSSITSGTSFYITGIQLEAGSVATPFSRAGGTIQGELAACQRYYYRNTATSAYSRFAQGGSWEAASARLYQTIQFLVSLRVPPTSVEISNLGVYDGSTILGVSSASITHSTTDNATLSLILGTAATSFRPYDLVRNAGGGGFIAFNAEL